MTFDSFSRFKKNAHTVKYPDLLAKAEKCGMKTFKIICFFKIYNFVIKRLKFLDDSILLFELNNYIAKFLI
jgi:hypothetical protein